MPPSARPEGAETSAQRRAADARRLARCLPFLAWRGRITRQSLRADMAAGLTGSLILVPQGVAFAAIAGMPPQYGLYAAMVPVIVSALFGSSWHLVCGPTTAISIVVFAALSPLAETGSAAYVELALTLSFLSGLLMLVLGCLRMGSLMNFVSHTVVVGFTAGAAVLIAASQIKNFFGLPIPRGATLAQMAQASAAHWDEIKPWVLLVSTVTLLTGLLARRYLKRVPHVIVALVVGSLVAAGLNQWMGPERAGVATLAALPRGLPPLSVPDLSLDTLRQLLPIAVALALLSLTEALSIARALALKTGQRLDSDQEFIGQGLANVTGAFFSSYPSSGSFNRSGLNLESGARTPLAAVCSALLLALIVQFVAPVAAYLPLAAMAGVLFLVAWGLIDFHLIAHVLRTDRHEAAVLIGTFLATLFLTLEFAIFVGVLMSLMLYLNRTSRPVIEDVKPAVGKGLYHFSPSPGLPDCPQLKILRINGSIFFGAINHVQRAVQEVDEQTPTQKFLLLACPGVNFVDFAGSEMLAQEAQRRRNLGGELLMCALRDGPIRQLSQIGGKAPLRPDSLFALGDAHTMRSVVHRLDPGVCARCTKRVFEQCPPASRARQATELARATQRDN